MTYVRSPYTPNDCPVQAGDVVHNFLDNTDYIVLARRLDGDTELDELLNIAGKWYSGKELADGNWEYYVSPDFDSMPLYTFVRGGTE